MNKLLLGLFFIFSINSFGATVSQEINIGYKPSDFTIVGKNFPSSALADIVITDLSKAHCSNNTNNSYKVVSSKDPRVIKVINREIELSSSPYADANSKLTPNIIRVTNLITGSAVFSNGKVLITLRLKNIRACVWYQAKISGDEDNFYKLVDRVTKSLAEQICLNKPKIETCSKLYYTVTTTQKIISKLKPIEEYRGIDKDLKSFEEDRHKYYIFVDVDKGKILQLHIDNKSTRKIHKEAYVLNMKSCKYEVKKKDKLVKNLGGSPILKSEDKGWSFGKDTKFYINLPSSSKELSFTWGSLKKSGYYSKSMTYKKKIPKIVKDMMGKVNDMATLFRNESKNSKEIDIFKNLYDYPQTPQYVKCGGKVAMETLLIPLLDGFQDPKVEFKIDIRPSTKSEIKILKNRINIK